MKQRAADALLPIHVIVPNHVLATLLERALFSDTGYIAVHVEMPHEFAWRIARDRALAEGFLPTPEDVDVAIVLSAAAGSVSAKTPDYLRNAVEMSGFAPAALHTLRALSAAGVAPGELEALAATVPDPEKARLLARVATAYFARLKKADSSIASRCIAVRWRRCRSRLLASFSSEMSQSQRHSKRSQPRRPARNRSRGWGGAGHRRWPRGSRRQPSGSGRA